MSLQAPVSTSERVYQELRQMVVMGEIAQGDRLVQRQLATRLGVSSIPIIEATRRLQHDGLVVLHPNWGAQVRQWTDTDVRGAYQAREALEGIACQSFVENAGAVQKARLVDMAREFDDLARKFDHTGALEADLLLHSHIVRSSGINSLIHIVESSCLITMTLRNAYRRRLRAGNEALEPGAHDKLIEILLHGTPRAAHRAGRTHVRGAYHKLQALMAEEAAHNILLSGEPNA